METKTMVSCLGCGATNNAPAASSGKKVVCGRCKTPLPSPGTVIEPTPDQFQTLLQSAGLPLLIDFYSPSCAPCHMMSPVIQNLAERRKGELMVMKVNIDSHQQIAAAFRIMGVPTFIIIKRGHERGRSSGAQPEADFSLWVASLT